MTNEQPDQRIMYVHIKKMTWGNPDPAKNVVVGHTEKDCPGFPECTCMLSGLPHQPPPEPSPN